jgi:hypothetical protein
MRHHENTALHLLAGEIVEVRSAEEIYRTLDADGSHDALPFMPEMLQYCGKRFRVYKRSDKSCDTITQTGSRRMHDTVHLDGIRCTGEAHGGCQATCLLYWKEAWLKRASTNGAGPHREAGCSGSCSATLEAQPGVPATHPLCTRLLAATQVPGRNGASGQEHYRCQATEMLKASSPLPWWDLRQDARDLRSGNVRPAEFIPVALRMAYIALQRRLRRTRLRGGWRLATLLSSLIGSRWDFPEIGGPQTAGTPTLSLGLQPGELVRVKSKEEIVATLDSRQRNRGLWFDAEMLPYCGGTYRVLKRVDRIIDEATGTLRVLPNPCVILEGVTCCAHLSDRRLFCPRSIYPYWREIWLTRAA